MYNSEFSTSAEEIKPRSNFFRPDGYNLFLTIPVDLLLACNGNHNAAAILHILDQNSTQDNPWVECSISQIVSSLMNTASESTVRRTVESLISMGFLNREYPHPHKPRYSVRYDSIQPHMPFGSVTLKGCQSDRVCQSDSVSLTGNERRKQDISPLGTETYENPVKVTGCRVAHLNNNKNKLNASLYKNSINNASLYSLDKSSLPIGTETVESQEVLQLNTDPVSSFLMVYRVNASRKKSPHGKRSIPFLTERYGSRIEKIISEYGEENALEGIKAYTEDEFWQEKGLPLEGYLKLPYQWTKDKDGSTTPYNESKKFEKLDLALVAQALSILENDTI